LKHCKVRKRYISRICPQAMVDEFSPYLAPLFALQTFKICKIYFPFLLTAINIPAVCKAKTRRIQKFRFSIFIKKTNFKLTQRFHICFMSVCSRAYLLHLHKIHCFVSVVIILPFNRTMTSDVNALSLQLTVIFNLVTV